MNHTQRLLDHIDKTLRKMCDLIEKLICLLTHHVAKSLVVQIHDLKGNIMSASLQIGQTATAVATEWSGPNGTGTILPPAGPIAFSSSDPTIATVDPVSGLVTAVGVGTATITGTDATNGLSGSDTASVSSAPVTAQSLTVVVTANASSPSRRSVSR